MTHPFTPTDFKVELYLSIYDGKPAEMERDNVNQAGVQARDWEPQPIADQVKVTYFFASEMDRKSFVENLTPKAKGWMRQ